MRWVGLAGVVVGVGCASGVSRDGAHELDAGAQGSTSERPPKSTPDAAVRGSTSSSTTELRDASVSNQGAASVEEPTGPAPSSRPAGETLGDAPSRDAGETTILATATADDASAPSEIVDAAATTGVVPPFTLTHDWAGVSGAYCHGLLYCWQLDGEPLYLRLHFEQAGAPFEACLEYVADGFFAASEFENGKLTFDWERVENIAQCRERVIDFGALMLPLTDTGSECRWGAQCRGGSCDTEMGCPGVCVAGLAAGQTCEYASDCADGNCLDDRCVAAEDPVFDLPMDAECSWSWDNAKYCAAGTWCTRAGQCVGARGAGEPCDVEHPFCPRDYVCADDETGGMSCAKVNLLPLGASCNSRPVAEEGAVGVCDAINFEICRDGRCQRPAPGNEGDACISLDLKSTCNAGLYCEWGANICRPIKAVGETCGDANECHCNDGICSELACSEH